MFRNYYTGRFSGIFIIFREGFNGLGFLGSLGFQGVFGKYFQGTFGDIKIIPKYLEIGLVHTYFHWNLYMKTTEERSENKGFGIIIQKDFGMFSLNSRKSPCHKNAFFFSHSRA